MWLRDVLKNGSFLVGWKRKKKCLNSRGKNDQCEGKINR